MDLGNAAVGKNGLEFLFIGENMRTCEMIDRRTDYRLDRTAFSVAELGDEPDERAFWFSKTPDERLRAAEFLRQSLYGYDIATARLQRVLEVVEFKPR